MDFKIKGLDELTRKLDRLAKDATPAATAERMRGVRCPDHGEYPTNVRVVGDTTEAEFCCEKLRKLATDAALKPIRNP